MSSNANGEIKVACVSDIHLGHPRTPTLHILDNLKREFPDNAETGALDIIFFAGDLTDRLLYLPDDNVTEIKIWMNQFLRMCARRNIIVRVLEGTPSHDWGQSALFETINELGEIGADCRYIKDLCIEYIEPLGYNVLYVPDEWEPEPDDTWKQVVGLLENHGLKEVDLSIMHGAFPHQLPAHVQAPMHDPDRYQSITRHYVFIGHIHLHTQYGRILAQGSFDRLNHGEEGAKGHLRVTIREGGDDTIHFVENTGAKVYTTIDCRGLELDEALAKVDEHAQVPDGSYLRIHGYKQDPIMSSLDVLRTNYPTINWDRKQERGEQIEDKDLLADLRATYQTVEITPSNIKDMVMERVSAKTDDAAMVERCRELLEGAL